MSVSNFSQVLSQTAQFSKANSGFAATTAGPTQNILTFTASSGNCLFKQYNILSGLSQNLDLVSGNQSDLVGTTFNFSQIVGYQIQSLSGGVLAKTGVSGGVNWPQFGTQSGNGVLIDPGASIGCSERFSGYFLPLSATNGSIAFQAVSGNALCNVGFFGI